MTRVYNYSFAHKAKLASRKAVRDIHEFLEMINVSGITEKNKSLVLALEERCFKGEDYILDRLWGCWEFSYEFPTDEELEELKRLSENAPAPAPAPAPELKEIAEKIDGFLWDFDDPTKYDISKYNNIPQDFLDFWETLDEKVKDKIFDIVATFPRIVAYREKVAAREAEEEKRREEAEAKRLAKEQVKERIIEKVLDLLDNNLEQHVEGIFYDAAYPKSDFITFRGVGIQSGDLSGTYGNSGESWSYSNQAGDKRTACVAISS